MTAVELIGIIAGAVGIISGIVTTVSYFAKVIQDRKSQNPLIGKWYSYHYTFDWNNTLIFRKEEWEIKRAFLYGYKVATKDVKDPNIVYKGRFKEFKDASINGKMKSSSEFYNLKMKKPYTNNTCTYAIVLGLDFRSNIVATMYLFSKCEFDKTNASNDETIAKQHLNNTRADGSTTQLRIS